MQNLFIAYPEIVLALVATAVLLMELLANKDAHRTLIHAVSLLGLAAAGILTSIMWHDGTVAHTFNNMFVSDPLANLAGAARYLRQMLDRFGTVHMALAAYNAGPGAVERAGGIP